jgi:O-antigen ligase
MLTSPHSRLKQLIQISLLLIVALMPLHAFLSVWLGHIFGHEAIIQAWKEALLLVLAAAAVVLVWRDRTLLQRLRQPWILIAGGFVALAILVTLITRPPLTAVAFGLKTDLEFLLAAVVATLVATPEFTRRIVIAVLAGAVVVVGFGLLQIFVLPADFLTHFGYGPSTILPYQHITAGTNALRFPSTLGGPNQLGTYLILPLCLSLLVAIRRRLWWLLALPAGGVMVLVSTYSRSAWIGAAVAVVVTLIYASPAQLRRRLTVGVIAVAIIGAFIALPAALNPNGKLQYYLLHSSVAAHDQRNSDTEHAASLRQGLHDLAAAPLGHGLGTAGPATFHAGQGNIIENYYLQIGFETGIIGMLAFIAILGALTVRLWKRTAVHPDALPVAAAILGIGLVGLVLPSWTDSSTALIAFIAAGALTGLPAFTKGPHRV